MNANPWQPLLPGLFLWRGNSLTSALSAWGGCSPSLKQSPAPLGEGGAAWVLGWRQRTVLRLNRRLFALGGDDQPAQAQGQQQAERGRRGGFRHGGRGVKGDARHHAA